MESDTTILISSAASTRKSLEAIRNGVAGLSDKRKNILSKVPESNNWEYFPRDSVSINDIAYLSAHTHHEFALLRGKNNDIVFHGTANHCHIDKCLIDLLVLKKLKLIAHTHPDYGDIEPSDDDRTFLRYIGQKSSIIISYITGIQTEFSANIFDDV